MGKSFLRIRPEDIAYEQGETRNVSPEVEVELFEIANLYFKIEDTSLISINNSN